MHPSMIAKRQLEALNKVTDSMTLLAERFGIDVPAPVQNRDQTVGQMMRWEAVAAFMGAMCLVANSEVLTADIVMVSLEDVLAIDGLSKAAIDKITAHYGRVSEDET